MTGILLLTPIIQIEVSSRFPNTKEQHITLAYGVERGNYEPIIGFPVTVFVTHEAYDKEIQALRAILPYWLPCQNVNPHITISWVDGSAPVRSNLMLEGEHEEVAFEAIVYCTIEFVEWGSKPSQNKTWKDSPLQRCQHVWKTGNLVGKQCPELTRRSSGYCTKHRPKK